jgi:Rieske Fe-S protein
MRKIVADGERQAPDRRQLLKLLGGGLVTGLALPAACARAPQAGPTRVALTDVPPGGRLRVLDGELPVEIRRTADGDVAARSLWCTHMGCEVKWQSDRDIYLCPCHRGVYDAEGRPVSGPPVSALREIELRVRGGEILIGGSPDGSGS